MNWIEKAFLSAMTAGILLPLCCFNWKRDSVSPIDNRRLSELDFDSRDVSSMLDSFFKDRIGFRTLCIDAYTQWNDILFGEMAHPTYEYGRDGYVFFKVKAEQEDREFIDAFCAHLRNVQEYCENRNIPFIYCINPAKTTIYHRYLPSGYTYRNYFLQYLYQKLKEYNINYISNVELLEEKSLEEQVFNVKYDAGHWNDQGCFYGTSHLLEKISEYFPGVRPYLPDDFICSWREEESLPASHFRIREMAPYFANPAEGGITEKTAEFSSVRLNENYPGFGVYKNENPGSRQLPRVLFFHGSYYNSRIRFYDTSFQETYRVHNYENFIDFDYYFNLFQPECVILETAEYATTRNYFNIDKLKAKRLNPPLSQVMHTPHDSYGLQELSCHTERQDGITTIEINLHSAQEDITEYDFGYLVMGEYVFDLELDGERAVCAAASEYAADSAFDSARVELFVKQGDED